MSKENARRSVRAWALVLTIAAWGWMAVNQVMHWRRSKAAAGVT